MKHPFMTIARKLGDLPVDARASLLTGTAVYIVKDAVVVSRSGSVWEQQDRKPGFRNMVSLKSKNNYPKPDDTIVLWHVGIDDAVAYIRSLQQTAGLTQETVLWPVTRKIAS